MRDLDPNDVTLLRQSPFFDADWYVGQNPDVVDEHWDPVEHFLRKGADEGRDPSFFFNTRAYMARWPHTADGTTNPLVHFIRYIRGELPVEQDRALVSQSSFFQPEWYLKTYPDVAREKWDPLEHYLEHGAWEGRDPGPNFSTRLYFEQRPDVEAASLNPLIHFLRHGMIETLGSESLDPEAFSDPRPADPAPQPPARKLGRKAVFVTHDFNVGGAPRVLQWISEWFQLHTDYDVHIVAMANGPFAPEFEAFAPVLILERITVADEDVPALRKTVRDFLGGEEPAFTFVNSSAAGHYLKIDPFQAPVFGYVHELETVLEHFRDQCDHLMTRAQHVFCAGPSVHAAVLAMYPDKHALLETRPPFVRPRGLAERAAPMTPEEKAECRRALGWHPERKVVLGCGVAHWRKQPFVFVRAAATLIKDKQLDVEFVWAGGGEDIPAMQTMAEELGIADRLRLIGHQSYVWPFYEAADVFALTSLEDPFPLVCLEAVSASVPLVVFREATAITTIIEPDGEPTGGAAVTLGDEAAFCDALAQLVTDPQAWADAAVTARARVLPRFTEDRACRDVLAQIRAVAQLPARVSVILPSYNSAPYLKQRLDSIVDQQFRDVEILLLDDASRDESPAMLAAFAKDRPEARLLLSDVNSGSVFRAWERGIAAATGDIVWLAEADDFCEPDFLTRALAAFAPSGTRLVHGRSIPTNSEGVIAGDWNDLYLDRIVPGLWRSSFVSPAATEINRSIGRANSVVNASAVLIRRPAAVAAIGVARHFKLAGDWAFYVCAIHGGRIAYCHEAVNYHRRHTTSVTAQVEGTDAYFEELAAVGAIVRALYGADTVRDEGFLRHIGQEATRFNYPKPLPEGVIPPDLRLPGPGVLFGVGDLSGGGAQMFAMRFVNKWTAGGSPAVLFVAGYEPDHPAVRAQVDPSVPIVGPQDIEDAGGLGELMRSFGLDLAVTGHWWADLAIGRWMEREQSKLPWVIIMHGCYESVLENAGSFADFTDVLTRAERHCAHWVWTAPKNKRLFDEGHVRPRGLTHIVNGFEPVRPSGLGRAQLGLPEDGIVFTLASRAIEEKGWFATLEAFGRVRDTLAGRREVALQLIGDGPAAAAIRDRPAEPGVHMVPHTGRLADYIAASDVGLLPSWFVGESLPLVLIEFLAQGKAAIVSDIGMCPWALGEESEAGAAGIVVRRDSDGAVAVEALADAMLRLVEDDDARASFAARAPDAFGKFDMNVMADRYRDLFGKVLQEEALA